MEYQPLLAKINASWTHLRWEEIVTSPPGAHRRRGRAAAGGALLLGRIVAPLGVGANIDFSKEGLIFHEIT